MVSDWINLMRIRIKYPNIDNDIKIVLQAYNEAKTKNHDKTIRVLADLMPYHTESGNKFWSFINLEVSKADLELEEFAQTSMGDLSNIIEGASKSLLIEQVLINKIIRGRSYDFTKVITSKLGNLIEELIQHSNYSKLFKTHPDNLKLSDWRNISAHHSYEIKKKIIHCKYDHKGERKTISINRDELFDKVNQCLRTMEILNMAHTFFGFDNMDEIRKCIKPDDKYIRDETSFLILSSGIMSQGFEIMDLNYKDKTEAILVVRDLTNGDPIKRGIHASQFLVNLWAFSNRPKLTVKYEAQNGELLLMARCKGEICKLVASGQKEYSYLAKKVDFEKVKTD